MARALVCLGDKTSFGKVVSATATWHEGNKPIAQSGDKASCSKCNGNFQIIASAVDWGEKQPYAATGDRVACDCSDHYVFGSATQYTSTGTHSALTLTTQALSVQTETSDSRHHVRYHCADLNGQALSCRRYLLIFPDGDEEAGITDNQGHTEWHFADTTENICLRILKD
ncbi:PAAR domain-containing protein [Sodalis sp. RH15]|jgi:uncharacterized Zn-binding protein involved in type VI secretion|uniref:PAAR domain-containing protein n=1 Tax=Sodalis sp. RH15 TaxID=3394330 RepID=UPI0039B44D3B